MITSTCYCSVLHYHSAVECIKNTAQSHAVFWRSLRMFSKPPEREDEVVEAFKTWEARDEEAKVILSFLCPSSLYLCSSHPLFLPIYVPLSFPSPSPSLCPSLLPSLWMVCQSHSPTSQKLRLAPSHILREPHPLPKQVTGKPHPRPMNSKPHPQSSYIIKRQQNSHVIRKPLPPLGEVGV